MNVVLIGATSAVVTEFAYLNLAHSNHFFLVSKNEEKLNALKQNLLSRGAAQVHCLGSDLSDTESYANLVEEIQRHNSHIDLLLLGQGVLPPQSDFERDNCSLMQSTAVNYLSVVYLLNALAPQFERQKQGSIAVISSVAGIRGRRSNYLYGSQKAGVQAFVEGYAARMQPFGVHVLDIRPGLIDTPMTAHMKKNRLFSSAKTVAKDIMNAIVRKKSVLYTPAYWWSIMFIVRLLPRSILRRLKI